MTGGVAGLKVGWRKCALIDWTDGGGPDSNGGGNSAPAGGDSSSD